MGMTKNSDNSPVRALAKAALQGNGRACCQLGLIYHVGKLVPRDDAAARALLERAALLGYIKAHRMIEKLWPPPPPAPRPELPSENERRAVKCRLAAEQGDAAAQRAFGWCCEFGKGVSLSLDAAAEWYRKSAEQGNVLARISLGNLYRVGKGVPQDYRRCVEWYRKAAAQGHADAQCNMGWCYGTGSGVSKNYSTALEWYEQSARQGNATARDNIHALQAAFAHELQTSAIPFNDERLSIALDGTVELNSRKCCIYIRNQSQGVDVRKRTTKYRYHLCNCRTIQEMVADGRKDRYVATARDDSLFEVNVISHPGQTRLIELNMQLCQNCRELLRERGMYQEPFSLKDFYAKHQSSIPEMFLGKIQKAVTESYPPNVEFV